MGGGTGGSAWSADGQRQLRELCVLLLWRVCHRDSHAISVATGLSEPDVLRILADDRANGPQVTNPATPPEVRTP